MGTNSKICIYCFCVNVTVLIVPFLGLLSKTLKHVVDEYWLIMSLVYALGMQLHLMLVYRKRDYEHRVALRAGALGYFFGLGILTTYFASSSGRVFGWYISLISFFHFSEYLMTAISNPKSLSLDSFLLNHSKEYGIAALASWLEFGVEKHYVPELKEMKYISVTGLCLCVAGELVRKAAMFTAGTNFNHIIQSYREDGHVLVTHGLYAWWRHPSYVGWFWWSVGTQIVLCNPICTGIFAIASWRFFHQRIIAEEMTLLKFFGGDYVEYQKKVPTGLPFIRGFLM